MKKLAKMTILFLLLLISGCQKKDKLEIDEEKPEDKITVDDKKAVVEVTESKPLVVVSKDDTVNVLVRADGAPGMYLGDDGKVYGFFVDLEKMVMERMNQKYKFVPYTDVGSAAQDLKSGLSHAALAVPDLPDYQSFLNLSIPYETYNYITFVVDNNTEIKGSTREEIIKSLHGKKVGVQTTGFIFQHLRDIKEIELVEYATTTKAMEGLHLGQVDAVLENRETGEYYSEIYNWNVKPVGKNILSHTNTSGFSTIFDLSLLDRYNSALRSLLEDGSVDKLRVKYYGDAADEYKP